MTIAQSRKHVQDRAEESMKLAEVVGHLKCYVDPHLAYLMSATPEQTALATSLLEEIAKLNTFIGQMAQEDLDGSKVQPA